MSYLPNLIQVGIGKQTIDSVLSNFQGFCIYMVAGLLCSSRWIYSYIAIFTTGIVTMLFYILYVKVGTVVPAFNFIIFIFLLMYPIYFIEKNQK